MELLLSDYSSFTGLRHCSISEYSGEDFYHKKLNEVFTNAIKQKEELYLIFDDIEDDGYTPSFIDESIGNLVFDFTEDVVNKWLRIQSPKDELIKDQVKNLTIPNWAKRRKNNDAPKITERHNEWYRYVNGKLIKKVWIELQ